MSRNGALEARPDRLLRWYPRVWRERYGEEFLELLYAEIDEQPRSWRRDVDVRWHGAKARFSAVGLGPHPFRDRNAIRTAKAISLVCFLGCLLSLWSQILRGSDWPTQYSLPLSVLAMCIVPAATFAVIGLRALADIRFLARLVRRACVSGHGRGLAPSLLLVCIGITLFSAGLVAVWSALGWGVTPTNVTIVLTESISAYWVHPHLLREYREAQIAWMVISPLAVAVIVVGSVGVHRALDRVAPLDRARARAPRAGWQPALLVPALLVSAWWVIGAQHSHVLSLRPGTLDLALLAVMTASLAVLATTSRTQSV